MNPEPHCKVKTWRFKPEYIRKNHLGPEGRLKAKRKAIAEYEMMAARGFSPKGRGQ